MEYLPAPDRYDARSADWFRRCGRSGLLLPAVSLGCWQNFGGFEHASGRFPNEEDQHENCRQMLFKAFDLGITHFDLANNYGPPPGSAEERVGRILREDFAGLRDELIISSKAGYNMWAGPYGEWGSRKYLIASCDQSLERLQLDYVDIFYSHRHDPNTPLEETVGALDQLVRSGKALYVGLSNYGPEQTREALAICEARGYARPIIHQPRYNLLDRKMENAGLFPALEEAGMGGICFSPLEGGVLTGKYLDGIPDDSRKGVEPGAVRDGWLEPVAVNRLRALNEIAQSLDLSLTQLALVWTLRAGACTSVLIGASRPQQVAEACGLLASGPLSGETLDRIEAVLA